MARTWNHNTHFYGLARRRVTAETRAIDVGCGEGLLTREMAAAGAKHVLGVDLDPAMIAHANDRAAGVRGLEYRASDVMSMQLESQFDLVTCFATLHHLDLVEGLRRLRELTAPGGHLVVVGLARTAGPSELALSLATLVVDPLVKARRGYGDHPAPVRDPDSTYSETESVAAKILPGSRFRRRHYYRFSLEWTAPTAESAR